MARDDLPIRRLRVLRQASYKCQVRDEESGAPCGAPAREAEPAERDASDHSPAKLQAVCRLHHGHKPTTERDTS